MKFGLVVTACAAGEAGVTVEAGVATGAVAWRYINLEDPWRRTPVGFDSRDLWLDLYTEGESDEWHWKDEDEIDWIVERGELDRAAAMDIRASGECALARVRAGPPPLSPAWSSWRRDPSWALPVVPATCEKSKDRNCSAYALPQRW